MVSSGRPVIVPSWDETLLDLHRAETVVELWSVLVVWHGIRSCAAWEEPYALFRRFHESEPNGAVVTAALLCTDHRWRKGSHLLVEHLADSGLIDEDDLGQLAEWFLGDQLLVPLPAGMFDGIEIMLADDPDGNTRPVGANAPSAHDDDMEPIIARPIWPPLRRWAANRVVGHAPERWRALLNSSRSLPSRDGVAIAAGVMDAAASIPQPERAEALGAGLEWGSGTVRLAALPGFSDLRGIEDARARAAGDASAKVRAWTKRGRDERSSPAIDGDEALERQDLAGADQGSLF